MSRASDTSSRLRRELSNKPLQRMNACAVRSTTALCRDGAGCARGSSRPWYDRGDRSAFTAERQVVRPSWPK